MLSFCETLALCELASQMQSTLPPIRTRFAPSPTGFLHKGHALSALWGSLRAQHLGGDFLVRIEDIDHTRRRPEMIEDIYRVLDWLGLEPSGDIVQQQDRRALYSDALHSLQQQGVVYPCICTRADILAVTGDPNALYPGTCRGRVKNATTPVAWRLNLQSLPKTIVTWRDLNAGVQTDDLAVWGDVIIARRDIGTSYHLAHVVDDAMQGITHVTRGQDLFTQTPIHRMLQDLLSLPQPVYDHHPLLMAQDNPAQKLSKRDGSTSLMAMAAAGMSRHDLLQELTPILDQLKS